MLIAQLRYAKHDRNGNPRKVWHYSEPLDEGVCVTRAVCDLGYGNAPHFGGRHVLGHRKILVMPPVSVTPAEYRETLAMGGRGQVMRILAP